MPHFTNNYQELVFRWRGLGIDGIIVADDAQNSQILFIIRVFQDFMKYISTSIYFHLISQDLNSLRNQRKNVYLYK